MGTWNTAINGNDTFLEIYQNFFQLYNDGHNPVDISKQILSENEDMFNDYDERNNSLFGLALAQWETKSLDPIIFNQVKEIIESGKDLVLWKGSDNKTLKKRQSVLEKFLLQISTEREKPKRRFKPKFEYIGVELLKLLAPDNNKTFEITESHVNGKYQDTSAGISWSTGGGSVFYFYEQGKFITARWIDSQTLEIKHDPTINFTQKRETFFYCGDQGVIKYVPV